jgi:hypothetical protein
MRYMIVAPILAADFITLTTMEATAVVCASGVHRAGGVGTGSAAVIDRPVVSPRRGVAARRGPLSAADHTGVKRPIGVAAITANR